MKHQLWLITTCLSISITTSDDTVAVAATPGANQPEVSVTGAVIDSREAARVTCSGGKDEFPVTETTRVCSSTNAYRTTTIGALATTESTGNSVCETSSSCSSTTLKPFVDQLRDQVAKLTAERNIAHAAYTIGQQREQKLALLEREKYGYVKAAKEKAFMLIDNVQHAEYVLAADAMRERRVQERLSRTQRTMNNRTGRRMQVIRRLLAGAEVALVQMESNRKLISSDTDTKKRQQRS